jgi:hypothetical protein
MSIHATSSVSVPLFYGPYYFRRLKPCCPSLQILLLIADDGLVPVRMFPATPYRIFLQLGGPDSAPAWWRTWRHSLSASAYTRGRHTSPAPLPGSVKYTQNKSFCVYCHRMYRVSVRTSVERRNSAVSMQKRGGQITLRGGNTVLRTCTLHNFL